MRKSMEDYAYENSKEYTEEELVLIRKSTAKRRTISAVFAPLLTFSAMISLALAILEIILQKKGLTIALVIAFLIFISVFALYVYYVYQNYQERVKLLQSFHHENKKPH